MTSYFTSSVSIFMSRRRVEIQTTSEMTPYFSVINRLLHTLLAQLNAIRTLPSSISTISMTVVKTTLFNTCARCGVKYGLIFHTKRMGKYIVST